jgi:hypothetical protein
VCSCKRKRKKRSKTIIKLFLSKRKSISTVSQAYKSELAGLISVATSYKHAYNRRGLKDKLSDVNICEQQTINQLIISNQLSFDCSNSNTKSRGYLMSKLITVVFKA